MENLAEYLNATTLPETEEERQKFTINTKEKAAWAVRKIKHIRDQQAENDHVAEKEIERISAWQKAENERLQKDVDFFAGLLAMYHHDVMETDPRAKTIKLPHGQLQYRTQQPEFHKDDDQLLAWIKANELPLVRVKEEPEWGELKKAVEVTETSVVVYKETGEVVEGVTAVIRPPKFTVKTD